MGDVLTYLNAERILGMFKFMSFETVDSGSFERRTSLPSTSDEIRGKIHDCEQQIYRPLCPDFKKSFRGGLRYVQKTV